MAEIRPFNGLRYGKDAGDLQALVAPPYDVIKPDEREEYAARNPYNIVHLTLPESKEDDRSKYVKYTRSAAAMAQWRRENVIAPEAKPAFYRYTQTFDVAFSNLESICRTSFIALIKTEPYEKGVVLPHEQTFPKHKEDRLRLLEATRSHLECIFGLYEDPVGHVLETLRQAPAETSVSVLSDDGVQQLLEPITDPEACAALTKELADKKIWIADGHHRYETAVNFRLSLGEQPGPVAEDYMMMALSSMSDPGLVLLPTHRILSEGPDEATMLAKLAAKFEIVEVGLAKLYEELVAHPGAFAVAFKDRGVLLTAKDPQALVASQQVEGSTALRSLDVTILHRVILEELLGIEGTDRLAYTRDPMEAIQAPKDGAACSFLMNPPTVDDMRTIALGGEKMPQKSTYYFPKILSGLVMWSLNDF